MSPVLPLLIKSPNNRIESGSFRECYILNPEPTTPASALMYKFLGAFFGFCFMTQSPMPLNLAPIVWRQILQEDLTLEDLNNIDSFTVKVIKDLKEYGKTLTDEEFEAQGQVFTTVLSNGQEVELLPDGAEMPVTRQNLGQFIDLLLEKRF
jgi:hypothetical protein